MCLGKSPAMNGLMDQGMHGAIEQVAPLASVTDLLRRICRHHTLGQTKAHKPRLALHVVRP